MNITHSSVRWLALVFFNSNCYPLCPTINSLNDKGLDHFHLLNVHKSCTQDKDTLHVSAKQSHVSSMLYCVADYNTSFKYTRKHQKCEYRKLFPTFHPAELFESPLSLKYGILTTIHSYT